MIGLPVQQDQLQPEVIGQQPNVIGQQPNAIGQPNAIIQQPARRCCQSKVFKAIKTVLLSILQILTGIIMVALLPVALAIYIIGWPAFMYYFDKNRPGKKRKCIPFFLLFLLGIVAFPVLIAAIPIYLTVLLLFSIVYFGAAALKCLGLRPPCLGDYRA